MIPCPYCGRWFKNKQALRAHLKYCPLKMGKKPKINKEEIKTWEFEHLGNRWVIKGSQTAFDIFKKS